MQKQLNYLLSCPGTPQEGRRLFPKYIEHFTLYDTVVVYLIDKYAMIFSLHD